MHAAEVIRLDSRRRKVFELMQCMFCCTVHALVHSVSTPRNKYFGPCPGCDEEASLPLRQVQQ